MYDRIVIRKPTEKEKRKKKKRAKNIKFTTYFIVIYTVQEINSWKAKT